MCMNKIIGLLLVLLVALPASAAVTVIGTLGIGSVSEVVGTGDPSVAPGLAAPTGSIYTNTSTGSTYRKFGATATDWTLNLDSSASSGSFPTLNQNTTGTASNITASSNTSLTSLANLATVGTISSGTWSGTAVALNKGGTGQTTKAAAFDALSPMTTGGQIIYGGASGTGTALANGSSGQVLTSAGGTTAPSWTTIVTSSSTVLSKTGNYTIVSGDGTILCDASGGSFTITLPSVGSVTSQKFTIKRTDNTIANQVTITGTIDGASDWKLYTVGETLEIQSNGTIFSAVDHVTETPFASAAATTITATTTNPTKGNSPTVDTIRWRRHGNVAEIVMSYKNSTATGSAVGSGDYLYALPTGLTADTTDISLYTTVLGTASPQATNILGPATIGTGSSTGIGISSLFDSTHFRLISYSGAVGASGSANFALNNSGAAYQTQFSIPISGWKP